jgi:hypothetical protein
MDDNSIANLVSRTAMRRPPIGGPEHEVRLNTLALLSLHEVLCEIRDLLRSQRP